MKKTSILKKIKNYIGKVKLLKEQESIEEKNRILNLLNRMWSENQIKDYNCQLLIDSAGWLGGNYTELDIKKSILSHNAEFFSKEEYEELYNNITGRQKQIKNR